MRLPRSWTRALFVIGTAAVLALLWSNRTNEYPLIQPDAYENLTAAYNLVHHGVISIDDAPGQTAPEASEYREPVPILVLAAYISALPSLEEPSLDQLVDIHAETLKRSNMLWGVVLSVIVFVTVARYTGSYALAAFGTVAADLGLAEHYNGLYSEVAAAALLAATCAAAATAVRRRHIGWMFATGLLAGVVALTKAAFLYAAVGLILCLAAVGAWRRLRAREDFALRAAGVAALGLALAIAPWMVRNYLHFDRLTLSSRGGQVLLTRALKNGMSAEEYRGAWFAYAPRPLRWITGRLTGFDKRDLQAGGRLVRLVRYADLRDRSAPTTGDVDGAVSYFAKAKAMRTALELRHPEADVLAIDDMLKRRAFELIRADPGAHLATTPLFLWRGAPYVFLVLLAGIGYAAVRRRWWLFAYAAPAMALVVFYALLTHFIPRYGDPLQPVACVVFAVLAHALWRAALARYRGRAPRPQGRTTGALAEPRMTEVSR